MLKPPMSTTPISKATIAKITAASGKFFQKLLRSWSMRISSIITTKRNSTITAPRYTITRTMARNSALSSSQIPAACENANIRCSTACTGFGAVTTRNAAYSSTTENR
ncbi:hypothetical protein D3C72_1920680 [compost metagenome]